MYKNLSWLIFWIVICLGVGWLAGMITAVSVEGWYAGLRRPPWTPPDWLFGPVWTMLYITMGCAAWLIQISPRFRKTALFVFAIQLILNFFWSILFFGLESPGLALVEISLLWVAILATIFMFYPIHRGAAWLLVPYLTWVSFAAVLNSAFWWLNRGGS